MAKVEVCEVCDTEVEWVEWTNGVNDQVGNEGWQAVSGKSLRCDPQTLLSFGWEAWEIEANDRFHHVEEKTYKIVRHRQNDNNEVVRTGLTLDEAQAHCRDEDTHGDGWFDGYTEE